MKSADALKDEIVARAIEVRIAHEAFSYNLGRQSFLNRVTEADANLRAAVSEYEKRLDLRTGIMQIITDERYSPRSRADRILALVTDVR